MARIETRLTPATSQYGAHMGTCQHFPEMAEAWERGKPGRVEITSEQFGLTGSALVEKAVALLRARKAA